MSEIVLRITGKSKLVVLEGTLPPPKSTIAPALGTIQFLILDDVLVQRPGHLLPHLLIDVLHDDVTLEIVAWECKLQAARPMSETDARQESEDDAMALEIPDEIEEIKNP